MLTYMKKVITIILVVCMIIGLATCVKSCYEHATYKNIVEYGLVEIEPNVYGYYNAVVSSIPSQNYEVIVLYFNDQIFTLKGHVNIHYTDDTAKLIWTDVNIVHGDTFDVYVPSGTIVMRPNITQS